MFEQCVDIVTISAVASQAPGSFLYLRIGVLRLSKPVIGKIGREHLRSLKVFILRQAQTNVVVA